MEQVDWRKGRKPSSHDIARLIVERRGRRAEEGIAYADSPTNLIWRLQNDFTASGKLKASRPRNPRRTKSPSFTEITLNVGRTDAGSL